MRKIIYIIIAIVLAVGALYFFSRSANHEIQENSGGNPENSFIKVDSRLTFKNYNGDEVLMSDLIGMPLVINSWAAWCPFCKDELPDFVEVQKEFRNQVIFVAIDRAESLKVSKKYSDELGVTDDLIFLLDSSDSFYRSIGGFTMPETIFVDREGNIIEHKRGPMDADEVRQKVQNIL